MKIGNLFLFSWASLVYFFTDKLGNQQMSRLMSALKVFSIFLSLCAQSAIAEPLASPLIYLSSPADPVSECGSPRSCTVWKVFRTNFPLPYQTFAVSIENTQAVIVISEPPPSISRTNLASVMQAIFGTDLIDIAYYRLPTGIDGWLEDLVIQVSISDTGDAPVFSGASMSMTSAPASIVDRLRFIHSLFYGTIDGFWIDPADAPMPQSKIEELQISAADLTDWLKDEKQTWSPLSLNAAKSTWATLKSAAKAGVYERDAGGLIVWTIPKSARLETLRSDFRRFSVASDLLVGGLRYGNGGLVLLARKRAIPFALLPPLRFETFASFALNRSVEVVQSYERRRIFAGRIRHGEFEGWDWAPILLSQQLEDTEFGTLLNLADQILKSWSEHGRISYFGFDYPPPIDFPFGDRAASDIFFDELGTTSLVFNWNTELFASLTEEGSRQTITVDRTGALPILYIPGEFEFEAGNEAKEQAKIARDYFGTRGDPVLTRVTQNVLLYQAIQSFFKTADEQAPARQSRADKVASILQNEAARWIGKITSSAAIDQFDPEARAVTLQFLKQSGMSPAQLAEILSSPQLLERRFNHRLAKLRTVEAKHALLVAEASELAKKAEALFRTACREVGGSLHVEVTGLRCTWQGDSQAFNDYNTIEAKVQQAEKALKTVESQAEQEGEALQKWAADLKRGFEVGALLSETSGEADLDSVLDRVLALVEKPESDGSIRTPSVVLSKNTTNSNSIGGHNIGLVPSRIKVSATAKKPTWQTGSDAPTLILPPNRLREAAVLQRDLEAPLAPAPPESLEKVLKSDATGSLLEAMRTLSEPSSSRVETVMARASVCECDTLISQANDGSIMLARPGPPPSSSVVFGKSGVLDALMASPAQRVVKFEGMPLSTVENLLQTLQLMGTPNALRSNGFGDFLSSLVGTFRRTDSPAIEAVSFARRGKPIEILEISAEHGAKASLRETLPWRSAKTEIVTGEVWTKEFDLDPKELEGSAGVVVRFGGSGEATPEPLGILVREVAAPPEPLTVKLVNVVSSWLGTRPAKPLPLSEGLISLRAEIKKRLPEVEKLTFFYRRNAKAFRVADLE